MTKRLCQIILLLSFADIPIVGQESSYGVSYQTIIISNPAYAGSESDGTLRFSCMDFYPGNNYNLHFVFFSYDTYISAIHGGAGIYLSDDYLGGIMNDMRGGFCYSYHFQADENIFINAGLTASFYHRGFKNREIILPDQIDPLNGVIFPSGETILNRGRTVFDVGAGFLFITDRIYGGFSLNHLAKPYISDSGSSTDRLKRKLTVHIAGTFKLNSNLQINARPIFFGEFLGNGFNIGTGGVVENNSLSVNALLLVNQAESVDIQAGLSFKKGIVLVSYNYCFNIVSENRLLPMSLQHQAGLAISLNNVDKRKTVKTINFPKL